MTGWDKDVRTTARPRRTRSVGFGTVSALVIVGAMLVTGPAELAFASTAPDAPTSVSAVPGNGNATVKWVAPASDGGAAVTGYVVTPIRAGVPQPTRTFNSTAVTQLITGLTNTDSYTFHVAAKNSVGTGAPSAASSPVLVGLPIAPTNVTASASPGRATVRWLTPTSNGGAPITGYVVTPLKAGVAQSPRHFASTAVQQMITGLSDNVKYTFFVAARNYRGTGLSSAPMSPITVGAPARPAAPVITSAVPGNGRVVLTWSAPTSNGSASVVRYVVTPFIGGASQPLLTFNSTATAQTITGLTNSTTYRFKVSAGNAVGNSAPSAPSVAVTAGTPIAPPTVSAVSPGSGKATITWSPPTSNGGSPITGYFITPYVGSVAHPVVSTAVVTTRTITGLSHANTYTFKVAAKNANGTGAQSVATKPMRPNTVPVGGADAYATDEDQGLTVPAATGLLANDADADNDALQIEIISFGGNGIDLQPDGSFYYEPAMDRDDDDVFTYRLFDGIGYSSVIRVDIDITAVNDPPIVEGEQFETNYETTLEVFSPGVLANDYDPIEFDGVSASGPIAGPYNGTLVLNSNGSFTYTPDPGFWGNDSFTYQVSDSQLGGTATADITVWEPPPPEE